jgi:NSS family neurotransmitter:Na+ symporter
VLATIGSAVGLGNVWRFPYVCYANGGGAFLIPYLIALFTTGIPLLILEFGLGHHMRAGAAESFAKIDERMRWLGWAQAAMCLVVVLYYAVVMAWCWVYLWEAFSVSWSDDAAKFFDETVLGVTSSPLELGGLRWPIVIGLALTWTCVFVIIFRGVEVVGRVVKATVTIPLVLLVIFVIRGVTLPGAVQGLEYYFSPDFSRLSDVSVWLGAYGQVFYSSSLGFGVMIAYASYLPKDADVTGNAFITALSNSATSFFAGFAVFAALGYLSLQTGQPVAEVVESGPGLAFVTYPAIIAELPFWAPLFGVLFFVMLLTLGIDSAFSLVEGIVTSIADSTSVSKPLLVGGVCLVGFGGGLLFTTGAGLYYLDIVDHFVTHLALPLVGLFQCLLVAYVLKAPVLREHVNRVSDLRIGRVWDLCIGVITPAVLGLLFVTYLYESIVEPYEDYPRAALIGGGWAVIVFIFLGGVVAARIAAKTHRRGSPPKP